MTENIPGWISNLALDIYKVIQKYDALAYFQGKVREWALGHEAKVNRYIEWRRQRNLHFEQAVNSDPRLQDEKSGPPNEGWEWENYPLNISPQIDPDTKRSIKIVKAWVPPELLRDSEPDIKHILPLSREQQLSLTEKYTLLAAIYDFGRKGTDEIPPWEWPDLNTDVSSDELADAKKCLSFESLCDAASSLRQDNEGWLRAFLDDVENDLRKNVETEPDTKRKQEGISKWYQTNTFKFVVIPLLGILVLAIMGIPAWILLFNKTSQHPMTDTNIFADVSPDGAILRSNEFPWEIKKTKDRDGNILYTLVDRRGDPTAISVVPDNPKYTVYQSYDGMVIKFTCAEEKISNFTIKLKY